MANPISAPSPAAGCADGAAAPWDPLLVPELLDSIPDPVIGCDAAGLVVYWNRAACQIYGYTAEEAIGKQVVMLLQTRFPLPLLEIMEEVTDVGRWQGNLVHRAKDGREHTVESRWVARYDGDRRLVGGLGIERELFGLDERERESVLIEAEQERPVRELRHAQRLESLSQMAGGVAHDFNNALAIIINYAAFIASELEAEHRISGDVRSAAMRQDLAEIQTAAGHAAELTQKLLAFSHQAAGIPVAQNLNPSIGGIVQQTVGERGGTILLVEDERALLEVVRRILSGAGYAVIAAVDGPTALEAAAAHDGPIDILLTDVEMPEMLGHELADQLRAVRPEVRVMYMSGFSVSVLGAATRNGSITLIDKPFSAPALLESVRAAMTESP